MARVNDVAVGQWFRLYEFESPDTREVKVSPALLEVLHRLRALVGRPVRVLSGYRTAAHNQAVGGAPHSYHRRGEAADVTWAGWEPGQALRVAVAAGARGIGIYPAQGFVHVDVRPTPARWTGPAAAEAGEERGGRALGSPRTGFPPAPRGQGAGSLGSRRTGPGSASGGARTVRG